MGILETGLAVCQRATVQGAHRTTGSEQHSLSGGNVPFHGPAQARVHVGLTLRHKTQLERRARAGDGSHTAAGQKGVQRVGIAMRAAGHHGQPYLWHRPHANPLATTRGVQPRPQLRATHKQAVQGGREHQTQQGHTVVDQRNVHREFAIAGNELSRAVKGVDQPEGSADRRRLPVGHRLFRHHGNVWRQLRQPGHDDRLGLAVGSGHRGVVGFAVDLDGVSVHGHHDPARVSDQTHESRNPSGQGVRLRQRTGRNRIHCHGLDYSLKNHCALVEPYTPVMSPTIATQRAETTSQPDRHTLTHLQRLEAESIHIMREVVAEADKPVMLYSVGKDSAVMLHLAMKAFFPAKPPFPLLHVDTRWKFREMYRFRDRMAEESGMQLLVHINPEGVAKNINPFTHGSAIHTDIMKTEGLKQALDQHGFDAAFGGARRDEEKSRAKERIFSFRTSQHRWDPKNQRPELWHLYNGRKHKGESMRVFPLSNWTELDIWQYIHLQNIPIVPLYYAAARPVVERDGVLIMVDDERMPLRPGEVPMLRKVRFRTLGCYPLTGAVLSEADTLPAIIQEMLLTTTSERQGRVIDHDSAGSMEKKKQEGYF
jgi:sulfate adenylyltransferase subunit 2